MKLALWLICGMALALAFVGLATHLSAASLAGTSALTREELAGSLVDLGGKLAILIGLVVAFLGVQRAQWGWVAALCVAVVVTLFCGPLAVLTDTGIVLFIVSPVVVALLAIVYTVRTPSLKLSRVR